MNKIRFIYKFLVSPNVRKCMIWYTKALLAVFKNHDYPKGIKYYRAILMNGAMLSAENVVYSCLGQAYFWNKDLEKAEAALLKALKFNLKRNYHSSEVYEFMGYIALKKKEYSDALMYFDKAVQYHKKGRYNKLCYELETPELKKRLESQKNELPFLTAYAKQIMGKQKCNMGENHI